jgi:paraquat-inducible protein B
MAIDMIEDSEFSLHAPSRLGMKNFANDVDDYGGKTMPQYANLFGSQITDYANRVVADLKKRISSQCDKIDVSIAIIQAEIDATIKRSATEKGDQLKKSKLAIQKEQDILGEYQKLKAANCTAIEQQKKDIAEQKFQENLQSITESAVQKAKADASGTSIVDKIKNNKPIVIGGFILIAGLIAFKMFSKKD